MFYFLIIAAIIFLFAYLTISSPNQQCNPAVPLQFIYKTLRGDVSVAYIGHLCPKDQQSVFNSIKNSVQIVLTAFPNEPVNCICPQCLRKRGWLVLAYIPPTTYQAADIERTARELYNNTATPAPAAPAPAPAPSAPACADLDSSCADRFARFGCIDMQMMHDCRVTCNTCNLSDDQILMLLAQNADNGKCVPEEYLEFPYLL